MIRSKVIDILRTFSKEDIKKFSDYLASPLFNKREVILNLLISIKSIIPVSAIIVLQRKRSSERFLTERVIMTKFSEILIQSC
ncbi:MAG: hypothetical protein IPG09_06750 [Ignavibacteria bacterium]|nr:hypothetical protein [Ignavibacteria bacterium]